MRVIRAFGQHGPSKGVLKHGGATTNLLQLMSKKGHCILSVSLHMGLSRGKVQLTPQSACQMICIHQGKQVACPGAGVDDADTDDVHLPQRRVGGGQDVVRDEVSGCAHRHWKQAVEVHRQEERQPVTGGCHIRVAHLRAWVLTLSSNNDVKM